MGTYSIVARDGDSGELGVAVQSHWFAVGSVVTWAQPGVGAVATQSIALASHGPDALAQLARGLQARGAIDAVLATDSLAHMRQLGVVDSTGNAASHTGTGCIPHAGHEQGAGFACQANLMAGTTVPAAMASAYRAAEGDLAERLLAALEAAEAAGGDLRGRQSAALLVVPAQGESWRTRFDVRVDDDSAPLPGLRRLLRLARAYEMAEEGDALLAAGSREQARGRYVAAAALAPESDELLFWGGVGVAADDLQRGVEMVRCAARQNPAWVTLLERLPAELEPMAAPLLAALREQGERP
jgi:uncharacterized Ntn-hydrolase superfamily protein